MPVIPNYNKQLTPNMSGGGARARMDDPVSQAIAQVGGGLQRAGVQLDHQQRQQEEFEEKVRAQNLLLRGRQMFAQDQQDKQQAWQFGDDLRPQFNQDFDKWQRQNLSTFKTARIREYFNGSANQFRLSMDSAINDFQTGQIRQHDYNNILNLGEQYQGWIYQDASNYDAAFDDFRQTVELNQTLPPATKAALLQNFKNQAAYASIVGDIEGRPGMSSDAFMREYGPGMARATGMNMFQDGNSVKSAYDVLVQIESGGRQFGSDGKVLTSYDEKTGEPLAYGVGQILPSTAKEVAIRHTGSFDKDRFENDQAYNYQLGLWYFEEQMQRYGGDFEKAAAAYHSGFDNVDRAIADAAKPENQGKSFVDFLGPNGRKYVALARRGFVGASGDSDHPVDSGFKLPPHWDDMTFPQQRELFNKMMAASKARNTEFNSYFDRIQTQAMRMNRDGQLDGYQDILTPENFLRRYQNPMEAQLQYEAYQNTRLVPGYYQQAQQLNYPDLLAQRDALTNAPIRQDLNYSENEKDRAAQLTAVNARIKLFEDNPAYAVSASNPVMDQLESNVARSYQALQGASEADQPAAMAAFSAARNNLYGVRRGLQEQAGVYEPRILTNNDIEVFKSNYASLSQTDKGSYLVSYIAGMSPDNARYALKELESAKVIPEGSWLLANARDENSRSYVLNSLLSKPGDLKTLYGVDAATENKITAAARERLSTYISTTDLGTQQADIDARAVMDIASKVAVQQYGRTNDVDKSVDAAMETVFPGWQFIDGYSFWRRLTGIDYAPSPQIALPPGTGMTDGDALDGWGLWWYETGRHIQVGALTDASGLRTPEEALIETRRRLGDQMTAITARDNSGLILIARTALGPPAPILDVKGNPIIVPWSELADAKMRQAQILTNRRAERVGQQNGALPGYETYYPPGYESESYYLLD